MPEKTDEEIAKNVQDGDSESFGVLMQRYEEKLLRYAKRFLSDADDADDIVQEVFIKAYANIQSFDAKKRFSPWVYRIAHNEIVNELKKRSRRGFLFHLDAIFPHPAAKETADRDARRDDVRRALNTSLDRLLPKYREPLVLYYLEEMDYKEIADILKIPVSTVGVRLKRGKAQLKSIVSL